MDRKRLLRSTLVRWFTDVKGWGAGRKGCLLRGGRAVAASSCSPRRRQPLLEPGGERGHDVRRDRVSALVQQQLEPALLGPAPTRGAEQVQRVHAVAVPAAGQQEGSRRDQPQQLVLVPAVGEVSVQVPG